jgi:hypothetical protein
MDGLQTTIVPDSSNGNRRVFRFTANSVVEIPEDTQAEPCSLPATTTTPSSPISRRHVFAYSQDGVDMLGKDEPLLTTQHHVDPHNPQFPPIVHVFGDVSSLSVGNSAVVHVHGNVDGKVFLGSGQLTVHGYHKGQVTPHELLKKRKLKPKNGTTGSKGAKSRKKKVAEEEDE